MVVEATVPVHRAGARTGAAPRSRGADLVAVRDPDGRPDQALCRCGSSATPPHCDRSHRQSPVPDLPVVPAGDRQATVVGVTNAPDPALGGGPGRRRVPAAPPPGVPEVGLDGPRVMVVDDGPLVVHGIALALPDGSRTDGRTVAVCRCGDSRTHPWCDGDGCRVTST